MPVPTDQVPDKFPDRTGTTAPARDTGDTGDGDHHDEMGRIENRIGRDETNIDRPTGTDRGEAHDFFRDGTDEDEDGSDRGRDDSKDYRDDRDDDDGGGSDRGRERPDRRTSREPGEPPAWPGRHRGPV